MPSRLIHLRRPPILDAVEGPFVPRSLPLDEIDRLWEALRCANPAYFDGRLWHVLGVHRNGHGGATLHVTQCAYRLWAVQNRLLADGVDLGVRPLGVKGITWRGDQILLGRRSSAVAGYPGLWEFAPGGALEPGVDPADLIQRELIEETGLRVSSSPTPIAIVFDDVLRCWELVYRLRVGDHDDPTPTDEYPELRWCSAHELPEPLSPIAARMAALANPAAQGLSEGGAQSD